MYDVRLYYNNLVQNLADLNGKIYNWSTLLLYNQVWIHLKRKIFCIWYFTVAKEKCNQRELLMIIQHFLKSIFITRRRNEITMSLWFSIVFDDVRNYNLLGPFKEVYNQNKPTSLHRWVTYMFSYFSGNIRQLSERIIE